jgi:hypothetical protein
MCGSPWPAPHSSSPSAFTHVSPSLSRVDARMKMLPPVSGQPRQNETVHGRAMAAGQVLMRSSGSAPSPSVGVILLGPLGGQEGDAPFGRSCDGRDSPAYRQAPRPSAIAVGLGAVVHQLWGKGLALVRLGLGKTSVNLDWSEEPPAARNRSPELAVRRSPALCHRPRGPTCRLPRAGESQIGPRAGWAALVNRAGPAL